MFTVRFQLVPKDRAYIIARRISISTDTKPAQRPAEGCELIYLFISYSLRVSSGI